MRDTLECYKVLEIEPGSSAERIRRAYRDLSSAWDPTRYTHNPILRAEAEKKHQEIEEAYKAIQFFLPELQEPIGEPNKSTHIMRDFKELATGTQPLSIKTVITVLLITVVTIVAYSAWYLYERGLRFAPSPTVTAASSVPIE